MSQELNTAIAVIGIDIGKIAFHIVGLDQRGAMALRQKWSRGQVETSLATMPPCLIGMEACVGAHHLSRDGARGNSGRGLILYQTEIKMAGQPRYVWSAMLFGVVEVQPRYGDGKVETRLALHAHRLQSDGLVNSADEHIGTEPEAHACLPGSADVAACQRIRINRAGREHNPADEGDVGHPNVEAELPDRADIVLWRTAHRMENALHSLGRPQNPTHAALDGAVEDTNIDAGGSRRVFCMECPDDDGGK